MKNLLPGLMVTISIALAAKVLSHVIPNIGGVTLAIILGIIVGNLVPLGNKFSDGIKFSEKNILTCAIVLMGFKLNLFELGGMGASVFFVIIPMMLTTIVSAVLLGKLFGYTSRFSVLMGAGNAVCGSSAIAAVAPAVQAEEEEIGVSIGIVNLLGTIGIFLIPVIAHLFTLSDVKSSYLVGGTLQAVGQVVAAGFSINEKVGDSATLIKMLRVLMIGPVVMIVSILSKTTHAKGKKKLSQMVPPYIIGFFICCVLGSVFNSDTYVLPHLKVAAKLLLTVAMAGVGMKIKFTSLMAHGPKALLFGTLIAAIQIAFVLAVTLLFI